MNANLDNGQENWRNWDADGVAAKIDAYWLSSQLEIGWRRRLAQDLQMSIGVNKNITEIGCGSGLICQALLDLQVITHETYQGGDVSQEMLNLAKNRLPEINFNNWDIFKLPLADKSQQNTICIHVLQHLPDIKIPLQELIRVSRDSLYVASWFTDSPVSTIRFEQAAEGFGQKFYLNTYSISEFLDNIKTIAEAYGREIGDVAIHRYEYNSRTIHVKFSN